MDRTTNRIWMFGIAGVAIIVAVKASDLASALLLGWFGFLTPQYEFPWADGTGLAVGLAILILGCRRAFRGTSTRSTLLAGAIGLSLCLAGVALTGIAGQLHWLSRDDNWQRPRHQLGARNLLYWRVPVTETEIREELTGYGSDVSFAILRDCNGNRTATLLVPSDPKQPFVGAAMISDDPHLQFETHPRSELRSIIRAIEAGRWPERSSERGPR